MSDFSKRGEQPIGGGPSDGDASGSDSLTSPMAEVIDPNVTAPGDAWWAHTPDDAIDAAVAALTDDFAHQADERATQLEASASRKFGVRATRSEQAEHIEIDTTPVVPVAADTEPAGVQKARAGAEQKVSELTMLGVEQMLRRGERGGGGWGGKLIAVAVVLAMAAGWGFLLYREAGSIKAMPHTAASLVHEWLILPIEDALAPDDRFSMRGLKLAIEAAGWKPVGEESAIQTPDSLEIRQTYRRQHRRVHAQLVDLSDRKTARKRLAQVAPPARALLFDTKVVVLQPASASAAPSVDELAAALHAFHDNVVNAAH